MTTSPNSQTAPQTSEQFVAYLRARTEDAVAASVHHASLSQQYLTLSQKFAALAEQAASGHQIRLADSARALEREASIGTPAPPIGVQQFPSPLSSPRAGFAAPALSSVLPPGLSTGVDGHQAVVSPGVSAFYSPPARFPPANLPPENSAPPPSGRQPLDPPTDDLQANDLQANDLRANDLRANDLRANDLPINDLPKNSAGSAGSPLTEPSSSDPAGAGALAPVGTASGKITARTKRRARLSPRIVVERARRVALETAERVRVKAKKSDLQPQLRTTVEELSEGLRHSRTPAAISLVLTAVALLILALKQLEFFEEIPLPPLIAGFSEQLEEVEETLPVEMPAEETGEQQEQPTEEAVEEMAEEPEPMPEPVPEPPPEPMPEPMPDVEMAEGALPETPNGTVASSSEPTTSSDAGAIDNRSEAGRKMLLEKFGGSAASESAVGFALEWLAARQRANGTWDFNDTGPCTHAGSVNNPIGGTAYALLPFLAAGQTHREGQYKKQVQAGLAFLMNVGVRVPAGYDLRGVVNKADRDEDPNYAYYVHGAATLALCEAYGMTKDRQLKAAAEGAVLFLVNSQDPRGGGWRYNPQQPGSTSATAIQVMALKSAEKAGIRIPESTWRGASFYFDSVAVDQEGRYGYEVQKKSYAISVTSMAVLSRMYLGWGRDDGDLRAGIALIDKRGPYDNLYYAYFATQVMKNWGGQEWDRWNGRLRDDLIAWQETDEPAKGSWTPRDRSEYSLAGGRLLTTCLATLTLEVYYRYKPMLPEVAETSLSADSLMTAPETEK